MKIFLQILHATEIAILLSVADAGHWLNDEYTVIGLSFVSARFGGCIVYNPQRTSNNPE